MSSAHDAAEEQKTCVLCNALICRKLGNQEFNEKNFDKAVECYSEAIRLDPESHVYYSNRSAAYGALFKWELAEKDAQECVKRNPKFAKGYHRLANAQSQLGRKKEAIETLKTALTTATDPEKAPGIKKLLRQLNQELAAKSAAPAQGGGRQVPAHIAKELQELQPQFQKIQRELEQIEAKLAAYARQKKRLALVEREVADLPEGTKTYRSIGKMFLQTTSDENTASMKGEDKRVDEQVSSLEARKNYLNRQKQSVQDNITELLAQCT
ncbi:hypothetical protein PHYSODRAFT_328029 [Phytophthora sojae]|uniref:Uncharacterized protein n=1 Tax=Phytophthora sojae (strain P6497) TaxID=1094619 RepID=G4ZAR8_PHYSP|nr:hypothetical protein PHYSODRAFT_328029 [Phytophthora sojae]EGZ19854.1 hypothetical protein PHYSODRAFT_328029 [Phytophthora sojae]|eukprot:XP_009522571.1 hypothetical protein PHYSODRAFT_328029 [Phytophthora sojae]